MAYYNGCGCCPSKGGDSAVEGVLTPVALIFRGLCVKSWVLYFLVHASPF